MIDAILPAGGRIDGEFANEVGVGVKALIEIGGRTVLESTIDALRATGRVRRAVVIGPSEIADHACAGCADAVLPEGGDSGPANIIKGIEWLRETDGDSADRVLILTTDLPFVTPESICAFIDSCPPDIDLCAPLVARTAFEALYPGSQGFYVKMADGEWTLGCGFIANPKAIEANRDHIERVFAQRKSQVGMARLLGFAFIAKLLTGRLTVPDIECRCCEMLGCSGRGIPGSPPELAYDLDHLAGYRYAARHAELDSASVRTDPETSSG